MLSRAALTRLAAALPSAATAPRACTRCLSTMAALDPDHGKDYAVFPRERAGLNYDLNWSLADDDVTPGGDAYGNADVRDLLQFSRGKLDAGRALHADITPGADGSAALYCTDAFADRTVMGLDEFDARTQNIKDALHEVPRLFVDDAAVGTHRESEIRVRVISDSPEYSLFLRNLLVRVPSRNPHTVPRPLVVYIGTTFGDGSDETFTVSDFDPETGRGVVAVSGLAPLSDVTDQIAHVIGRMYGVEGGVGTIQSQRGGGLRIATAREEGTLLVDDSHYGGFEGADPLLLRGAATLVKAGGDGGVAVAVGASGAALASAASSGSLFAYGGSVWGSQGVSGFFSGATLPAGGIKGDLPRGAFVAGGNVTMQLPAGANLVGHPKTVVLVGGSGGGAAAAAPKAKAKAAPKKKATSKKKTDATKAEFSTVAAGDAATKAQALLGLSDADAEKFEARLKKHGTQVLEVAGDAGLKPFVN